MCDAINWSEHCNVPGQFPNRISFKAGTAEFSWEDPEVNFIATRLGGDRYQK